MSNLTYQELHALIRGELASPESLREEWEARGVDFEAIQRMGNEVLASAVPGIFQALRNQDGGEIYVELLNLWVMGFSVGHRAATEQELRRLASGE